MQGGIHMLPNTNDIYESGFLKSIHRHHEDIPINERLKIARERKKWTLSRTTREINALGISCALSTLQSYEAGNKSLNRRIPSLKMLISLANLYECSTDYLLGISDEINRYTTNMHEQFTKNQSSSWRNQKIEEPQMEMIIFKVDQIMNL
jgi:transcriptional regulator with XRE-family HTH domain